MKITIAERNEFRKKRRISSLKYYYKNKDKWIARVREYEKRNPEKARMWKNISFKNWYSKKKNKIRMKAHVKAHYLKNKKKFFSRRSTSQYIKKNNLLINKECKICGANNNLQIHHEIYPTKKEEIVKAINDRKIYFLCKFHHSIAHSSISRKTGLVRQEAA